jgi:serine/threonine protein phosphatase PrpC
VLLTPIFPFHCLSRVALEPEDEFIILGCDGIWDCLTNENAVQYVRERIDTKSPTEIGTEMLDAIISEDPRVTQGIGGDNMTIMIIDLLPMSRKGRLGPEASSSAE